MKNRTVTGHFEKQADACARMNSPFTAKLIRQLISVLDENSMTGNIIENWSGDAAGDALALRLCGGFHSIVISNPADPLADIYPDGAHPEYLDILSNGLNTHDATLAKWLELPPQTNETGRSAALMPGLLHIARDAQLPVHICEIGASAGLNMYLEQFHYTYENLSWGDPNSLVRLKPEMKGVQPDLSGDLEIISRIGCDISPVDILDPLEQLRLRSYIWPDQQYRLLRANGAIEIAMKNRPEILAMDAAEFVEQQLARRNTGEAIVLMHSVVWQYLPIQAQQKIENLLHAHGAKANQSNPIYWLRLEGFGGRDPAAQLTVDQWPNHRHETLAQSCFHGSWIKFA